MPGGFREQLNDRDPGDNHPHAEQRGQVEFLAVDEVRCDADHDDAHA
ncbi:hypothetical protein KPSA1_06825 [Pseudomonas syringae pv. actinidiae]|uniref:Uncharacterized protein n=1 Tax=Pseudomonas syringae pv. actinidiae TaxID=103796 RepID=A0A2V0QRR1_PSESF|nr:hypothetical protein KPSA1_06825 [Pseudomonas syringae pv. actinidiae]